MNRLTVFSAWNQAKKDLKNAGIENNGFEARQIIRHITGLDNAAIMARYNEQLSPLQQTMFNDVLRRRCAHYPLQYLLGEWSFYGLDFYVGEGVLIPRADTEVLVDTALEFLKEKEKADVIDLCSGSGCIAVAIAKNSTASVTALEKYEIPFSYLQKNIKRNGAHVTAVNDDVFSFAPNQKYDLVVSNPPYVSADEMDIIDTETSFEPDTALYGGEDGLMFYRYLAENWYRHIKSGGKIIFEVGFRQAAAVADILRAAHFTDIGIREDTNGIQRVVFGTVKQI